LHGTKELLAIRSEAVVDQTAFSNDRPEVTGSELVREQRARGGLHALESGGGQVSIVEECDKDPGGSGPNGRRHCPDSIRLSSALRHKARSVRPDHIQEIDGSLMTIVPQLELLGTQISDEAAVTPLSDDIDFDDVGGRAKGGRLGSGSLGGVLLRSG